MSRQCLLLAVTSSCCMSSKSLFYIRVHERGELALDYEETTTFLYIVVGYG
jgi:hypothetical protein